MGVGGGGIRHFCKLFCLQTSFSGDFLVVQPNYYFVNCIPVDTNQVKRERKWWFFVFFRIKLMTSDTCSIIIRNCICDILFNMMYTFPARLYHLFLIKSANSIWPWTASENRLPNKYLTISFSQCYNFFFSPFSGFSSLGTDTEWLIVTGEIFICGVSGNKIFSDREWDGFRNEHPGLWWSDTGSLVPSPQWGRGLPRGVLHIRGGQRLSGTRSLSLG